MLGFSVCMSVYRNDKPDDFRVALSSVINQTLPPSELVLVVDGPIGVGLNAVIEELETKLKNVKVIRLKETHGHAVARQIGIEHATNELIAIMDSDDIAHSDRFEKQVRCFEEDEMLSVLGGQIVEFVGEVEHVVGIREVPCEYEEIKQYAKSRCPMNQVTVMMRKTDMQNVGGYLAWFCNEDYYLWIRMLQKGYKFKNLPDRLVYVRVGEEMYGRRGGIKYFKSEACLQKYMWDEGIIGFYRYVFNVSVRWGVQVLLPPQMRGFIFQKLFRHSK